VEALLVVAEPLAPVEPLAVEAPRVVVEPLAAVVPSVPVALPCRTLVAVFACRGQ
jgi:hypothetical protein